MQGVYGIHNTVSDKWYVGQTGNIKTRWKAHRSRLRTGAFYPNAHLKAAWNKYGETSFEFVVLEEVFTACQLTEREEFWLQEKRKFSNGIYNIRTAADTNYGIKLSPETLAKRTAAVIGSKRSAESRARMSEAQKRAITPERRAAMSARMCGTRHSLETREKMAAAKRGKKKSAEFCTMLKARVVSEETRAKLKGLHRVLSKQDVWLIRKLHSEGLSDRAVAAYVPCGHCTVNCVVRGKAYQDIPNADGTLYTGFESNENKEKHT